MKYRIQTYIGGERVEVECNEATAYVLLALWSDQEPNVTECRRLSDNACIVAFLDPTKMGWSTDRQRRVSRSAGIS